MAIKKRSAGNMSLNITSMMDMFTIILVFLLKSYSAEGSIMTNADNLVLPNSISKLKPKEVNLQLAVTNDMVLIDNKPVVPTDEIRKIPQTDPDPQVKQIAEKLAKCLVQEQQMVKMGALAQVNGRIIIQVDKNIDFDTVFKIMNTCGKVGYNNMSFAVMEREE